MLGGKATMKLRSASHHGSTLIRAYGSRDMPLEFQNGETSRIAWTEPAYEIFDIEGIASLPAPRKVHQCSAQKSPKTGKERTTDCSVIWPRAPDNGREESTLVTITTAGILQ